MFEAIQNGSIWRHAVWYWMTIRISSFYFWNKIQFLSHSSKFAVVTWVVIYFATGFCGVKIISTRIFICMCIPKYFYFSKYGCTFVTAVHSSQNCSKRSIKQKYSSYKLRRFFQSMRYLIVRVVKIIRIGISNIWYT